ncbi:hypothetical protein predicted by Glimmer/Critica (plasmid) [Sinorhizobium fredii HH103]|uniref:Uncharacterized protein n=1 Tax=Sinorhizobium fredii (strain HH103) TaxID=1117943 RepID=G9AJ32_SINF1|nr:hypothetical protein predicted by Glimmer/Critica [Sinorhizobium fredii HH103]
MLKSAKGATVTDATGYKLLDGFAGSVGRQCPIRGRTASSSKVANANFVYSA